jgi:chemotaxis protein histidine kinase CheA
MQSSVKPNANDDRRDFVVIPSDQVRVAPSDAEITDLLRAAARQHSESGARVSPDHEATAPVPTVDTTFRATVSDDSPARGSTLGRRLMRALAALLVAAGITGAALGWQFFGYAAKKVVGRWLPQLALTSSLTMDKFGFGSESKPAEKPTDATADAAQAAAPAQAAADSTTPDNSASAAPANTATAATATSPPDSTQQLQSMAHDLANVNQEIETLKASVAELKASQQQMAHELAKTSEKLAEQGAKAKLANTAPRPAAHRPASSYSPTSTYSPSAAPPVAYRPAPSSYSVQAAVPPPATTQSSVPPPIPLQPEPGSTSVPRPPMPVQ